MSKEITKITLRESRFVEPYGITLDQANNILFFTEPTKGLYSVDLNNLGVTEMMDIDTAIFGILSSILPILLVSIPTLRDLK